MAGSDPAMEGEQVGFSARERKRSYMFHPSPFIVNHGPKFSNQEDFHRFINGILLVAEIVLYVLQAREMAFVVKQLNGLSPS